MRSSPGSPSEPMDPSDPSILKKTESNMFYMNLVLNKVSIKPGINPLKKLQILRANSDGKQSSGKQGYNSKEEDNIDKMVFSDVSESPGIDLISSGNHSQGFERMGSIGERMGSIGERMGSIGERMGSFKDKDGEEIGSDGEGLIVQESTQDDGEGIFKKFMMGICTVEGNF